MKQLKLIKEKWYFQSLRETKSVKDLDDGAVEISGYASTKDKDRGWDVVEPKAFQWALERYMTNPIVLLQHKSEKPIGIVTEAEIDENWLFIKAKISENTDWVIDKIKHGVLRAFSIWYSIKDYETDVHELPDWSYDFTNIIKDLELYEISVVSVPMNPYALSKSIKEMFEIEEKDVDENENNESNESEEAETPTEDKTEEEIPNEEVETKETSEEENENVEHSNVVDLWAEENEAEMHVESENNEDKTDSDDESVNNESDENSEISDDVETDENSENEVETPSDDGKVDEISNDEVIETKSVETESQKELQFKSDLEKLSKSFDEKLAKKDEEIKALESKVERMTKLFAQSMETVDKLTTAVKNTPVASGLSYQRPVIKKDYNGVAQALKNL